MQWDDSPIKINFVSLNQSERAYAVPHQALSDPNRAYNGARVGSVFQPSLRARNQEGHLQAGVDKEAFVIFIYTYKNNVLPLYQQTSPKAPRFKGRKVLF